MKILLYELQAQIKALDCVNQDHHNDQGWAERESAVRLAVDAFFARAEEALQRHFTSPRG